MRYTILFGFGEGRAHANKLMRCVSKKGWEYTTSIAKAEVVITHSGGCFFVPQYLANKAVLIANPICCKPKQVLPSFWRKLGSDLAQTSHEGQWAHWLRKTCWNSVYMVAHIPYNLHMLWYTIHTSDTLPAIAAKRVTVIANHHDPWATLTPPIVATQPTYRYLSFDGSHDDLWLHPQKYLDGVQ